MTVWEHSLAVMDHLLPEKSVVLLLTALLHDTGKVKVSDIRLSAHCNHDIYSAEIADRFLDSVGIKFDIKFRVARLIRWHMLDMTSMCNARGARNLIGKVGGRDALNWCIFRRAENAAYGSSPHPRMDVFEDHVRKEIRALPAVTNEDLLVDETDVVRMFSSIGRIEARDIVGLVMHAVNNWTFPNDRSVLLNVIQAIGERRVHATNLG